MSTEILSFDELIESQAGKTFTLNEVFRQIEGRMVRVLSRSVGAVPGSPSAGDTYIVDTLTGDWSTAALNDIAHYYGGAWNFYTPVEGINLWVNDEDASLHFDSTVWISEFERWDDWRFPAQQIDPTGPASPAGRDSDDGTLLFDASTDETLACGGIIPHSWKIGSGIRPHVHWSKTNGTSGNVVWQLEYKVAEPNTTFPVTWTTLPIVSTTVVGTPDTNTARKHLISAFDEIDTSAISGLAPIFLFRLKRLGTNAADTYNADAKFYEYDVHYLQDSHGSKQEFIK